MRFVINGNAREFPELSSPASIADLVGALALKGDRVAIEQNGEIVRRPEWNSTGVADGDCFEVVHFVGGGCDPVCAGSASRAEKRHKRTKAGRPLL